MRDATSKFQLGNRQNRGRKGGVYIAVLGASLIVSLLGMTALVGQRIQNRILSASTDMRQAQLNAMAAIEMGLLAMREDENWRANHTELQWFSPARMIGAGQCQLEVRDANANPNGAFAGLSSTEDSPVRMVGIGSHGLAEQRIELIIDPRRQAAEVLRASANAAGPLAGQNSTIDWNSVINTYKNAGTEININSLPTTTPNLGRNVGMETATGGTPNHWTGEPPGIPSAQISQSNNYNLTSGGTFSLRVQNRNDWHSGPAQRMDEIVKPGGQYSIEAYVLFPNTFTSRVYRIALYTKGTGDSSPLISFSDTTATNLFAVGWRRISATLTAQSWSGNLEYAFIKIGGDPTNTADFYLDDFDVREAVGGRFIYRRVLSPTANPFGTPNSQGIYWIDCGGSTLIIERSRIRGMLVLLNPGAGSRIADGPVHFAPVTPGYPSLLVQGNFAIQANNRNLSELENGVDYNLDGTPGNYIYPSEVRGLVAVSGNLTFSNSPRLIGQAIVGGSVTGVLDYELDDEALLNPPPGFRGPVVHHRRPGSGRKVVLP